MKKVGIRREDCLVRLSSKSPSRVAKTLASHLRSKFHLLLLGVRRFLDALPGRSSKHSHPDSVRGPNASIKAFAIIVAKFRGRGPNSILNLLQFTTCFDRRFESVGTLRGIGPFLQRNGGCSQIEVICQYMFPAGQRIYVCLPARDNYFVLANLYKARESRRFVPLDKQYFAFKGRQRIQRAQFDAHKLRFNLGIALSKIEVQARSLRKTNYQASRRSDGNDRSNPQLHSRAIPKQCAHAGCAANYSHRFRKLVPRVKERFSTLVISERERNSKSKFVKSPLEFADRCRGLNLWDSVHFPFGGGGGGTTGRTSCLRSVCGVGGDGGVGLGGGVGRGGGDGFLSVAMRSLSENGAFDTQNRHAATDSAKVDF